MTMEIVEYPTSLQWVGTMECPKCGKMHMIVVDGACVFSDQRDPYQVRIVNE